MVQESLIFELNGSKLLNKINLILVIAIVINKSNLI